VKWQQQQKGLPMKVKIITMIGEAACKSCRPGTLFRQFF
jgi:hypothetical protein